MSSVVLRGLLRGLVTVWWLVLPAVALAQSLSSGTALNGVIVSPGQINTHGFNANAGETVLLTMVSTTPVPGQFSPEMRLFAPDGRQLASDFSGNVARLTVQVPTGGAHGVQVGAHGGSSLGSYRLTLVRSSAPPTAGHLIEGGSRSGGIVPGGFSTHAFFANAGDQLLFSLVRTSAPGTFTPELLLFGPAGQRFGGNFGGGIAFHSMQAPVSGVYIAVATDNNRSGGGGFELHYVRAPGASEGGALVMGGRRSGNIGSGDLDSFSLAALAGDTLHLRLTDAAGSFNFSPEMRLYAPDGRWLSTQWGNDLAALDLTLPATGVYTLAVLDQSHAGSGDYTLDSNIDRQRLSFVALGDSFSSGEGLGAYGDASPCHRSFRAYALAIRLPGATSPIVGSADWQFDFLACSGAVTGNLLAGGVGQHGEPPQLHPGNVVDANRNLVTLTVGGNDSQFGFVMAMCVLHPVCFESRPFPAPWNLTLAEFLPAFIDAAAADVLALHRAIRQATPNAATLVFGYPVLLAGNECLASGGAALLSQAEQAFLREANLRLNQRIAEAATQAGLHFVPVADRFERHEVCGSLANWVYGLRFPLAAGFHPNADGHRAYANAANDYLASLASGWPHGYLPSGLPRNPPPAAPRLRAGGSMLALASLPSFGDLAVALVSAPPACQASDHLIVPGQGARLRGAGAARLPRLRQPRHRAGRPRHRAARGAARRPADRPRRPAGAHCAHRRRQHPHRQGSLEAQLGAVHDGEVDVLIGTQMVTKGHDFRRMTLVAAINPDTAPSSAATSARPSACSRC